MTIKLIFKLPILLLLLCIAGCSKVLDKQNPGAINPDLTWNDLNAANAYINEIYADIMPEFAINEGRNTDEGSESYLFNSYMAPHLRGSATIDTWNFWSYDVIHKINILLTQIDKGGLTSDLKEQIKGQAYFWRAFAYFTMVRAYGGVPLVLEPQDPKSGDALFLPRNKTSECIEQIVRDLDVAMAKLPVSWGSADKGKIDKSAAFAFKGRVLLYYASPQFNIQNSTERWVNAYNANKTAIDSCTAFGKGLFANFANIWYEDNNEVIIEKQYHYPELVYDENGARPVRWSLSVGWDWPTLELTTAFPMKDGSPYNVAQSGYGLLFKDRDPRYYATIAYNGSDYGIKDLVTLNANLWTYHKYGLPDFEGTLFSNTSFYRNKGIDKTINSANASNASVPWIELRFAEVLMNFGEAANEIGKTDKALDVLYQIRQRAGILPGPDNRYGITANSQSEIRDAYRNERFIEFAFENKRFWDLRRLRKFELLNQMQSRHGLYITLKDGFIPPLGKEDINQIYDEFNYEVKTIDPQPISWKENYYFFAIPKQYLDRNSKLMQTKGWDNGSFDPLQ